MKDDDSNSNTTIGKGANDYRYLLYSEVYSYTVYSTQYYFCGQLHPLMYTINQSVLSDLYFTSKLIQFT